MSELTTTPASAFSGRASTLARALPACWRNCGFCVPTVTGTMPRSFAPSAACRKGRITSIECSRRCELVSAVKPPPLRMSCAARFSSTATVPHGSSHAPDGHTPSTWPRPVWLGQSTTSLGASSVPARVLPIILPQNI